MTLNESFHFAPTLAERVDAYFCISQRKSSVRQELVGGLTTFAAMSYIVVVNPLILSAAGMSREGLLVATVLSAIAGTLAMALWANLPVALAPGMGSNIVFTQIVVLQMGLRWQNGARDGLPQCCAIPHPLAY